MNYQISENIYFEERLPTTASGIGIKGEISKKWIKKISRTSYSIRHSGKIFTHFVRTFS